MLAFVAALGAELSSGQSVLRQFAIEPTGEKLFHAASNLLVVLGCLMITRGLFPAVMHQLVPQQQSTGFS
jgi:hypothetical protein